MKLMDIDGSVYLFCLALRTTQSYVIHITSGLKGMGAVGGWNQILLSMCDHPAHSHLTTWHSLFLLTALEIRVRDMNSQLL